MDDADSTVDMDDIDLHQMSLRLKSNQNLDFSPSNNTNQQKLTVCNDIGNKNDGIIAINDTIEREDLLNSSRGKIQIINFDEDEMLDDMAQKCKDIMKSNKSSRLRNGGCNMKYADLGGMLQDGFTAQGKHFTSNLMSTLLSILSKAKLNKD